MCHGWNPLERENRERLVVPNIDDLCMFVASGALHLVDATALARSICVYTFKHIRDIHIYDA